MVFDRTFKCTGKVYYIKDEMNCESTNIIYLTIKMKCLEQYAGSAIKFKSRFRIQKSDIKTKKTKKSVAGLLDTLIINASIPLISLYTYVFSSLRRYIVFMMIVVLKIFYGIEKNIGSPNYLQT